MSYRIAVCFVVTDQFLAAYDSKLLYDTSILNPSLKPLWPFTLDYALPFTCPPWAPRCPLLSYPGLWEIPVTRLVGSAGVPYGFYTAYEFNKNPIEIADTLMKVRTSFAMFIILYSC